MKASLVFAIIVFIASLAAFGSACGIIGALASAGWITYVLRRFDRAECIDEEQFEQMALAEKRKKAMCRGTQCLKKSDAN